MASTAGSTAASTAGRERQEGVDLCVTMMIQFLVFNPRITVEEILNYLTWIGPEGNTHRLMQMFGGRAIFQRTLDRMEIIRQAKAQGRLQELPIVTERFNGTIPELEGNFHLWAPRVAGGGPLFGFPPPEENMPWEPLNRYPHEGMHSDNLWEQESESEASQAAPPQGWETDTEID